jgi:hypothetical protein
MAKLIVVTRAGLKAAQLKLEKLLAKGKALRGKA